MMSERALAKLIEAINRHIPQKGKTLAEMMKEDEPTIRARDGNEYLIEKKEIEFIAKHVDELDWNKFQVPIILEMCDVHGETVVYVRNKLHAEFIKKAFGYDRFVDDVMMLYLYEIGAIRRALKTASQVMFRVNL